MHSRGVPPDLPPPSSPPRPPEVVHCDLKPENVLCTHEGDGFSVKVADLGIAKVIEKGVPHKLQIGGTALSPAACGEPCVGPSRSGRYMAPEMHRNEQSPCRIRKVPC
jgi:serine/threonine protein kinase